MARLTPTNVVYLLVHLILIAGGVLLTIAQPKNEVLVAIGTSIIATGAVGIVLFFYVLINNQEREKIEFVSRFGFKKGFERRGVAIRPEYDTLLAGARHRIDIMGFGLRSFLEDYRNEFSSWKQRAHVRVLLLDPTFPSEAQSYALQRDGEEKTTSGSIASDVEHFIESCRHIIGNGEHGSFEIRLYRCLPSVNIFRIDDELFWGPYLQNEPSRNAPTFLIQRGPLFQSMVNHFDAIWASKELSRSI